MGTLYLHVGMNKTGSSALQRWFAANRRRLDRAGIAFPDFMEHNHGNFLSVQFEDGTPRAGPGATRGRLRHVERRAEMAAAFRAFLADARRRERDVLLSAEGASRFPAAKLARFAEAVRPYADRIVIVGFVRPPRSFVDSLAQERLKQGAPLEDLSSRPPAPAYRRRFGAHAAVFGADNVRLRPFHRSTLEDGCLLRTLLVMIDRDPDRLARGAAPVVNTSMSLAAGKLVAAVNRWMRDGTPPAHLPEAVRAAIAGSPVAPFVERTLSRPGGNASWPKAEREVLGAIDGARFRAPAEVRAAALAGVAEDLGWLSERFGMDLAPLDSPAAPPPPSLADFGRFDAAEIAAIREGLGAAGRRPRGAPPGARAARLGMLLPRRRPRR